MRFIIYIMLLFPIIVSCKNDTNNSNEIIKQGNKLNLDSLLLTKDTTNIMIALDNSITSLCEFGDSLNRLTEPQKNFFYIQNLEREVNNGGFNQYFFNSDGDYAHETLIALNAIGANHALIIMQTAINEFPNHIVPKDRNKRQEVLKEIEKKASKTWDKLDSTFYTYPDDIDALNINYIKSNRKDF
jgi:Domain of unknown function (DUF4375)